MVVRITINFNDQLTCIVEQKPKREQAEERKEKLEVFARPLHGESCTTQPQSLLATSGHFARLEPRNRQHTKR
jgi:hypothetical protein